MFLFKVFCLPSILSTGLEGKYFLPSSQLHSWPPRGMVGNLGCLCLEGAQGRQQSSKITVNLPERAWVLFLFEPFMAQA